MCKHAEKENGLHDLLEIMLESLMVAERSEFLSEQVDRNKGKGYRLGHTYVSIRTNTPFKPKIPASFFICIYISLT